MGRWFTHYDEENDQLCRYWVDTVFAWDENTETWRAVEDDPGDADLDADLDEDE